jgi:hypothetical protein
MKRDTEGNILSSNTTIQATHPSLPARIQFVMKKSEARVILSYTFTYSHRSSMRKNLLLRVKVQIKPFELLK